MTIKNYSIYEVTMTIIPTGKEERKILTTSKEKAKYETIKLFAENYTFIQAELRRVQLKEIIIEANDSFEYICSALNDHKDVETEATRLLHNAKCTDRIQNEYVIFKSDMLLKI